MTSNELLCTHFPYIILYYIAIFEEESCMWTFCANGRYLKFLSSLQNTAMNKFEHLGELLYVLMQMCRLTKACTEWLSHEPWKCQLPLITRMDQACWISTSALHAVDVDDEHYNSIYATEWVHVSSPDCGLQSEAVALGLTSLLQSA